MEQKKPEIEEDDGRVIADMNVEGMPWYRKDAKPVDPKRQPLDLTPGETWAAVRGMLKAALLVAGVFIAVFFLFILFCVLVWGR